MNGVNLIPRDRRQGRLVVAALRMWTVAIVVVVGAVVAGCVVTAAATAGHGRVGEDWVAAQARVDALQKSAVALRRDLVKMEAERRAAIAATDQPDWSILLRLVASKLDTRSSLRDVQLTERSKDAAPATATKTGKSQFEIRLSGYSPSPAAASAYVLRLQQIGLFDDVSLLRTMRQGTGDVSFEILCTLSDSVMTIGGRP